MTKRWARPGVVGRGVSVCTSFGCGFAGGRSRRVALLGQGTFSLIRPCASRSRAVSRWGVWGSAEIGRFVAGLTTEPVGFLTGETIYLDGAQNVAL
jgi:hypothetical protein